MLTYTFYFLFSDIQVEHQRELQQITLNYDVELSEQDIIEHLEELSLMSGSRLEVISGKTEEGAQLASLGKIGAILRFKQNNQ